MQGYVSRTELQLEEWSSLKVSVRLETVSLSVRMTRQMTEMGEDSGMGGLSSLMPLHVVLKTVLENLKVQVDHVIVHFEAGKDCTLQCDVRNLQYERTEGSEDSAARPVQLVAGSIEFSVLDTCENSSILRFLNAEQLSLLVSFAQDGMHLDLNAVTVNPDISPEALCQIQTLVHRVQRQLDDLQDLDEVWDEAASVVESVFYDAEESLRGSSDHSSFSESAFFDCEDAGSSSTSGTKSVAFKISVDQINAVVNASASPMSPVQFFIGVAEFSCHGTCSDAPNIEATIGEVYVLDQSPDAAPIGVCQSAVQIPETLHSLMSSHVEQQCSYARLGFSQLQKSTCMSLKIQKAQQTWTVSVQSVPVVFWTSCESVQRCCALVQSLKSDSGSKTSTSESSLTHIALDWEVSGIYGALEQPKSEGSGLDGLLALELKTGDNASLISVKECRDSRTLRGPIPAQLLVTVISVSELNLYHCPFKYTSIVDCHCIATCAAQQRSLLSTEKALTIEITQTIKRRQHSSDLSNLAYNLINAYSRRDGGTFQERTLGRVEYEGKCINSADLVFEVLCGSVTVDVNLEDVEACMDTVLQFWRPSRMAEQMKTSQASQMVTIVNGTQFSAKLRDHFDGHPQPLELHLDEVEFFSVSGVQRKTISTMALTLNGVALIGINQNQLGSIGCLDGNDGPSVQFFQVSELDFRNARFKQWTALQQRKTLICLDSSVMYLNNIVQSVQKLVMQNKDRIQTDIEVEQYVSLNAQETQLQYKTLPEGEASSEICLKCVIDQGHMTIENMNKGCVQLCGIALHCASEASSSKRLAHETALECLVHHDPLRGLEVEVKNQCFVAGMDPQLLADLMRAVNSISALQHASADTNAMDVDESTSGNLLEGIAEDAFSANHPPRPPKRTYLDTLLHQEEDEDGFIIVEKLSEDVEAPNLKSSRAAWLEGASLDMRDDYISLPQQREIIDEVSVMQAGPSSSELPRWTVKCTNLSGACAFSGAHPSEHIDIKAEGFNVVYKSFGSGSRYQDRLTISVQEIEVADCRSNEQGKRLLERNRCQLRTACSRRLKQQKPLSCPLVQLTLETVLPDTLYASSIKEKRFDLRFVPLRLRLSHSLWDFVKSFFDAMPSSNHISSGDFLLCLLLLKMLHGFRWMLFSKMFCSRILCRCGLLSKKCRS